MAVLATPEWFDEVAARTGAATVDDGLEIGIEQRILGESPATWHVVIASGRVMVSPGPLPDATLRISSDRPTAEAIHAGQLSAQRAFLDGNLQIGGDVGALIENRPALALIAGILAGIT